MISGFCNRFLNGEYLEFSVRLLDRLKRKRTLDITRGKASIWAAAIVTVIARLNFLFDKKSSTPISVDRITDFFGTNKSTTSQKATLIETECNIQMGEEGLCLEEITDALTVFITPEGLIIPKNMRCNPDWEIDVLSEEESRELEEALRNKAQRKTKPETKNLAPPNTRQLNLFGDD